MEEESINKINIIILISLFSIQFIFIFSKKCPIFIAVAPVYHAPVVAKAVYPAATSYANTYKVKESLISSKLQLKNLKRNIKKSLQLKSSGKKI